MKKSGVFGLQGLAIAALMVLLVAPVHAGGVGPVIGTWDTDQAGDDDGGGFKVVLDLGQRFEFEVRGTWFDELTATSQGDQFRLEAFPVDLGFAYNFIPDGKVQPYVGVGGTFLFLDVQPAVGEETTSRPHSQEEAGYYFELGLEFPIAKQFSVIAEALYRSVSGEVRGRDLGTAPEAEFGVDLNGASGYLGLLYTW